MIWQASRRYAHFRNFSPDLNWAHLFGNRKKNYFGRSLLFALESTFSSLRSIFYFLPNALWIFMRTQKKGFYFLFSDLRTATTTMHHFVFVYLNVSLFLLSLSLSPSAHSSVRLLWTEKSITVFFFFSSLGENFRRSYSQNWTTTKIAAITCVAENFRPRGFLSLSLRMGSSKFIKGPSWITILLKVAAAFFSFIFSPLSDLTI